MPYTYSRLKGRIIEKFGTRSLFAEKLGISEQSLSLKLNCKTGISQKEITEWANLLDIKPNEYGEYFFA